MKASFKNSLLNILTILALTFSIMGVSPAKAAGATRLFGALGNGGKITFTPPSSSASAVITGSPAPAITAFNFASPAATGVINETAHTIALTVPFGTNVTSLVPNITHTGASVSPIVASSVNFNDSTPRPAHGHKAAARRWPMWTTVRAGRR